MSNVRVSAAVVFFVTGLLLILGTQRYFRTYKVDKPLREDISSVQGVVSYELGSSDGLTDLAVTLRDVEDLPATYEGLQSALARGVGKKGTRIEVLDSRSLALEKDWYHIHYFVEEAAALGNFSAMKDRVDRSLQGSETTPTIWVKNDRIFVELRHAHRSLYEVVERRYPSGVDNAV